MAEKKDKDKGESKKPEKPDRAPRHEKGDKGEKTPKAAKAQKAEKGDAGEKAPKARQPEERVTPRLKTYFEEVVRQKLSEEFGYKNRMQVPVLEKVVINMGIGAGGKERNKVK